MYEIVVVVFFWKIGILVWIIIKLFGKKWYVFNFVNVFGLKKKRK